MPPLAPLRSATLVARALATGLLLSSGARPERDVLDEPATARVFAKLCERPGLSLTELNEDLRLGWGALYLHLSRLRRASLVQTRRQGRRKLLYPVADEVRIPRRAPRRVVLRPSARLVAEAIRARPGLSMAELLAELPEVQPRMVYRHVQRFVREGLATSASPTRYVGLRATPRLGEALDEA